MATTGAEPDFVDAKVPDVKFVLAAPLAGTGGEAQTSPNGRIALFDFDGDGWLDMSDSGPGGTRLYRNVNGDFKDVTRESGLGSEGAAVGVVAADYDNDGKPDLFVLRPSGGSLLHNDGGRFTDATAAAGLPALGPPGSSSAAFADVDHDGDLDLVLAGQAAPSAPFRLFRNNGNGTFADVTATTGLGEGKESGLAIVPTDYDNRRDLDLLVLRADRGPALFRNLRDGRFRDDAGPAGLPAEGRFTSVTAADVDKDGRIDFYFTTPEGRGALALSDGLDRFRIVARARRRSEVGSAPRLRQRWPRGPRDPDGEAGAGLPERGRGEMDGGGARDDTRARRNVPGVRFRGRGRRRRHWTSFCATGRARCASRGTRGGTATDRSAWTSQGRVSNKQGVGARVEMRAGSLRQRLETAATTPAVRPARRSSSAWERARRRTRCGSSGPRGRSRPSSTPA